MKGYMDVPKLLRSFRSPFKGREDRLAAPAVSQTSPGINPEPEEPPHYICPACGFEDEKKPFDLSKPCPKCKAHFLVSSLNEDNEIGKTIFSQIRSQDKGLFLVMGAKDFVLLPDGLKFKIRQGTGTWRWITVQLDKGSDTYDVTLSRMDRNLQWKEISKKTNVYSEDLPGVIEGLWKGNG